MPDRLSHDERTEIRRLMSVAIQEGEDVNAVARRFNRSRWLVYDACREFDVEVDGGRRPRPRTLAIYEALRRGWTIPTVAKACQTSETSVKHVQAEARKLGLPMGRRNPKKS